jgi:hypothetical protein
MQTIEIDAEIARLDKLLAARKKHRNAMQALAMYEARWPRIRARLKAQLDSAEAELRTALLSGQPQ